VWQKIITLFSLEELTSLTFILLKIILILVLAKLAITVSWHIVDKTLMNKKEQNYFWEERKVKTIAVLLKSIIRYGVYALVILMILREIGINTSALLAGAGVLGLAVGFGAQSLVKDVITGFFILFEDQYSVGDYIVTPDAAGTVEEIGLRITKIRDANGGLHILPNSEIRTLTNFNRGYANAVVDVEVAYHEDTEKTLAILQEIAQQVAQDWADTVTKDPEVMGVTQLGQSGISFRILMQTLPMQHWKVERELRKKIKNKFEEEGIEIPYPHQVILQKKAGEQSG